MLHTHAHGAVAPYPDCDVTTMVNQLTDMIKQHRKAFRRTVPYQEILRLAKSCVRDSPPRIDPRCITEAEVRGVKAMFARHDLVISTLDHNAGMIFVSCRKRWMQRFVRLFNTGPEANYTLCTRDAPAILKDMRASYLALGLQRIAPWNRKSEIPPSYMLAKQKGPLEKYRPIRNCRVHAARVALNAACRVYSFLIAEWSRTQPNFNCANIHDYPSRFFGSLHDLIHNTAKALDKSIDDLAVLHVVSDIKDMYTCLPHHELMSAAESICGDLLAIGHRR